MAINVTEVRCTNPRHRHPDPPAVAVARIVLDVRYWRPLCTECLAELEADPDPVAYDVAYLDPTRQRRPQSWTAHDHAPGAACNDRCHTVHTTPAH